MCPFECLPTGTTGAAVICQTNQIYCLAFIPPYGCDMYVCGQCRRLCLGFVQSLLLCDVYSIRDSLYTFHVHPQNVYQIYAVAHHVKRLLSLPSLRPAETCSHVCTFHDTICVVLLQSHRLCVRFFVCFAALAHCLSACARVHARMSRINLRT